MNWKEYAYTIVAPVSTTDKDEMVALIEQKAKEARRRVANDMNRMLFADDGREARAPRRSWWQRLGECVCQKLKWDYISWVEGY